MALAMLTASMRDASVEPRGSAEAGAEIATPTKSAATNAAAAVITIRTITPRVESYETPTHPAHERRFPSPDTDYTTEE